MFTLYILGASTENLPPGVLYKVKASYKYQAEDVDELQFEVGEVIHVVQYEDPDEQVHDSKHVLEIRYVMLSIFRRKVGSWA